MEMFSQKFLVIYFKEGFNTTLLWRFWKPWVKFPVVDDTLSSYEKGNYPTTSLDEKCMEFEFHIDWNYCIDSQVSLGNEIETCQMSMLQKKH